MNWTCVAVGWLFAALFAGRFVCERALSGLSSERKVLLLDGFRRHRLYGSLPLLVVVGGLAWVRGLPAGRMAVGVVVGALFFVGYLAWWQIVVVRRRFRKLGFPPDFIRAYSSGQWLGFAGWFGFLFALVAALAGGD